MRILSGRLKGRKIITPGMIRPVKSRVRKSCFDILRPDIEGKQALDLFGGSGALGLEAISQGASSCTFVDSSRDCVKAIKTNIEALGIQENTKLHLKDSLEAIKDFFTYKTSFDLIFLDPPYCKGLLTKALQALGEYDILAPAGYIVTFSYSQEAQDAQSDKFTSIIERKYGQTLVKIYQKEGN
tara:strand:+ start:271 stop:822 length:552 start_codon:yes stop_codon:yes gene_type:complete